MTKDEILRLHTLSEDEQEKILIDNKILESLHFKLVGCKVYESLADCAFRLRDEVCSSFRTERADDGVDYKVSGRYDFSNACKFLIQFGVLGDYSHLLHHGTVAIFRWFAKPIHWIQAALLAKLEKGE